MNKKKDFLVYLGNPGIGKTHLCAALVPFALENFDSFRYHTERQLLTKVRESMDLGQGDFLNTLKYNLDDPLVFIDDIGSSGLNDWRKDVLFEAIDMRYNTRLPTVITSNFNIKEFKKAFHPRFTSRLFAACNTIIELDTNEDFRQLPES
jgi:DNA replication protein DnaC